VSVAEADVEAEAGIGAEAGACSAAIAVIPTSIASAPPMIPP
jgi:hypothetical protein